MQRAVSHIRVAVILYLQPTPYGRLGKREPILIQMEILASLFESPKGPTRLAQACNVNYGRIGGFVDPMVEKGLIRSESAGGQERILWITDLGYQVYRDWLEIWRKLPL